MSKKSKTDPARDIYAEALAMPAQAAATTMMATATHFQAKVMEQTAGFTFEIFDFINERLGQDIAASRALGQCASVEEAFKTLGEFQKKALEDYTCETARLSVQSTFTADALRDEVAEDAEALGRVARGKAA